MHIDVMATFLHFEILGHSYLEQKILGHRYLEQKILGAQGFGEGIHMILAGQTFARHTLA